MSYRNLNLIGGVVGFLGLIWFFSQLISREVSIFPNGYSDVWVVMWAVIIYSAQGVLLGSAWYVILRGSGQHGLPFVLAVSIVCVAQFAKYIPGNVAHHIGRVLLAKNARLDVSKVLFSIFVESMLLVSVASLIALVALSSKGADLFGRISQVPSWWVIAALVGATTVAPLLGHRFFEFTARWWAQRKGIAFHSVRMLPIRDFGLVGFLYLVNYLILGAVLQIIATQVFDAQGGGIVLLTSVFAIAWIVGFITPGAPAGLGVREVVIVASLAPTYDSDVAIGIAAVLRIVTVLGDGSAFLIGLGLGRWAEARLSTE